MELLETIISYFCLVVSLPIIGNILIKQENKLNKIKLTIGLIIILVITTITNIYNGTLINDTLRVLLLYISFSFFYKYVYNQKLITSLVTGFIVYIIYVISEVLLDIPLYIIISLFSLSQESMRNIILINLITSIISIIISHKFKDKLSKIINEIGTDQKFVLLISILVLLILSLELFSTPLNELQFDFNFIISALLIVLFCILGIILIIQIINIQNSKKEYIKLANYSKITETVLEEYRVNVHEKKNQLVIIDGMIPKKYKEVHEYINSLLNSNNNSKYSWVSQLKYIPLSELKSFINYKLMEMTNDKIKLEINVSRDIDKNFFTNYRLKEKEDLYSIIGVLLDNAQDAAKESRKKEVSIQISQSNNKLNILIANTYKGKIDLEKIDIYGYSSKGSNHGTGLHIVKNIINRNKKYNKETKLIDKYFIQEITINK